MLAYTKVNCDAQGYMTPKGLHIYVNGIRGDGLQSD